MRMGMDGMGIDIVERGGLQPGDGSEGEGAEGGGEAKRAGRPALQVYFRCANVYLRVLRSADGSRYQARCPKCGKDVRFAVGEGGSAQRFFEVSC